MIIASRRRRCVGSESGSQQCRVGTGRTDIGYRHCSRRFVLPREPASQSFVPALLVGGAVFAGLAFYMRGVERRALSVGVAQLGALAESPRPVAEIASAVAAMKLVTVEIDTKVRVERGDENWRGLVKASVEVPVRLRYGVDLSGAEAVRVGYSSVSGGPRGLMVVRVPAPALLATEVFSEREVVKVDTEGLRLRTGAGEYFLGLARRDLPAAARELVLRPEDADRVCELTRERIEELVRKLVGDDVAVFVRFEDPGAHL
ncbi:MAG: DUF4230 domain-containing protein [Phycisphaerales bacterium]